MAHAPKCLKCGLPLPHQEAADGSRSRPKTGDVAICWECGEAMIFEGVSFRLPTKEEFTEIMEDDECSRILAAVAIKVSGVKDPAAVIFSAEAGRATVISPQPPAICEMCGKLDELRPYGPRKADGARLKVCMRCADKDPADALRAFLERLDGRDG
jgi:hypothetical protein